SDPQVAIAAEPTVQPAPQWTLVPEESIPSVVLAAPARPTTPARTTASTLKAPQPGALLSKAGWALFTICGGLAVGISKGFRAANPSGSNSGIMVLLALPFALGAVVGLVLVFIAMVERWITPTEASHHLPRQPEDSPQWSPAPPGPLMDVLSL